MSTTKVIRGSLLVRCAIAAGFSALLVLGIGALVQAQAPGKWITAWGTSQNGMGNTGVTNATVRMIARVTISGDAVRIRLDNTFGKTPVAVGKAYVGLTNQGANLVVGSNQQAMFNKSASVTIPAGGPAARE